MSISSSRPRHNECTCAVVVPLRVVEEPWSDERLFHHHFGRLRAVRARVEEGYLVASVFANRSLVGVRAIGCGEHLVVGRHSQCEVQLERDRCGALRHLLVRVERGPEGPVARLLDLRTGQPFALDGEHRCEAALAEGDAFLRTGEHALLLLRAAADEAAWSGGVEAVWRRRPRVEVAAACLPEVRPAVAVERRRGPRRAAEAHHVTRVTQIPGAVEATPTDIGQPLPADAVATLSVELPGGRELIYALSAASLRRGVLLGRYARCGVRARALDCSQSVSRVHALILGDERQASVLDTASSGGTFVDGAPVRSATLGPRATIELSPGNALLWRWLHAPPSPPG